MIGRLALMLLLSWGGHAAHAGVDCELEASRRVQVALKLLAGGVHGKALQPEILLELSVSHDLLKTLDGVERNEDTLAVKRGLEKVLRRMNSGERDLFRSGIGKLMAENSATVKQVLDAQKKSRGIVLPKYLGPLNDIGDFALKSGELRRGILDGRPIFFGDLSDVNAVHFESALLIDPLNPKPENRVTRMFSTGQTRSSEYQDVFQYQGHTILAKYPGGRFWDLSTGTQRFDLEANYPSMLWAKMVNGVVVEFMGELRLYANVPGGIYEVRLDKKTEPKEITDIQMRELRFDRTSRHALLSAVDVVNNEVYHFDLNAGQWLELPGARMVEKTLHDHMQVFEDEGKTRAVYKTRAFKENPREIVVSDIDGSNRKVYPLKANIRPGAKPVGVQLMNRAGVPHAYFEDDDDQLVTLNLRTMEAKSYKNPEITARKKIPIKWQGQNLLIWLSNQRNELKIFSLDAMEMIHELKIPQDLENIQVFEFDGDLYALGTNGWSAPHLLRLTRPEAK